MEHILRLYSFVRYNEFIHVSREWILFLGFLTVVTTLILYKVVFIANMPWSTSFWVAYGLIATTFLVSRLPHAYLYKDAHTAVYPPTAYPSVSIVIPAKNEEKGIFKTIESCVHSNYPGRIECIVIDDGSTDQTKAEVLRAEQRYGKEVLRLISFPENLGKREAMAAGIHVSTGELIVFVDSDSFLSPGAIRHAAEHFLADAKVGAVAGNTKVANPSTNLLTKMQSIQYACSFDIYKASESVYGAVTCCPGCFSAYRRAAVTPILQAWRSHRFFGSKSTFGDDRGLTNYVLQAWKIQYCQHALASTTVPERFRTYIRQQLRWKKSWIREGSFASTFMWRVTHPMASLAFYINFTFPVLGPILAGVVIWKSGVSQNPLLLLVFVSCFVLLGAVFALFVRIYFKAQNWMYMPLFSLLYVTVLIWLMPLALLTIRKTGWGTR